MSNTDLNYFAEIPKKIPYGGPDKRDVLAYKYYQPDAVVMGKPMKDWLRFSVCYWHSFRGTGMDPFGMATLTRPWDDGSDSLDNAKRRLRVAFDFMSRLGVDYWTFHDRDIAPEGATLEESHKNLDELVDLAEELQKQTGIRLLWATQNLFAHPRYMNGAATNPDAHVFAYAAAQTKKVMEVCKRLGGENLVFWGGREGYQSILNTDVRRELDHLATFLKMVVEYKAKIGADYQLLVEPKPREPTKHQYDYDAMTVIAFLRTYGLDKDYKLNIEPNHTTLAGHDFEHDIILASKYGMLGSVDSNTGDQGLGWDTDQFPMDVKKATLVMKAVIEQGGLVPGGLNFDAKVRRESCDVEDMFIAHIGAMDTFARGLLNAAKILSEGVLPSMVAERYSSYDSGFGKSIEQGKATLEDCEAYVKEHGEPSKRSGQQEKFEVILNDYV